MERRIQIDIAGSKRAGKSTLAKGLANELNARGFKAVIVDIDAVRHGIFGEVSRQAKPGTPESLQMHAAAWNAIVNVVVPLILKGGGSPIVTATHSVRQHYCDAKDVAVTQGVTFKFLLLETPSIEELKRRVRETAPDDASDVRDPNDPNLRQSLIASGNRIRESYDDLHEPCIMRVSQGIPSEMLEGVLPFVLDF